MLDHELVAVDDQEFTPVEVRQRLGDLFGTAKEKDEFEFASTLMRIRGMEDAGWDPFAETHRLVEDVMTLIGTPLVGHTKARLGLLLYGHLTEVWTIYSMLANLTRVVLGKRYVIDPFLDAYPRNRKGEPQFLSTPGVVKALSTMLDEAEHGAVRELLQWFVVPGIRNAFAHADYTLHEDEFRSRSEFFEVGGIRTPVLKLDLLAAVINRALTFYDAFVLEYEAQRGGYDSNKTVLGRLAGEEPIPVELLANPDHGLYGLRSPPGGE